LKLSINVPNSAGLIHSDAMKLDCETINSANVNHPRIRS